MDDISLSKANSEWERAYKFNNRIYEIMQFIVKKEKPRILMNRNPTLNYYSMLLMRVRKVKKDITDFTLSVDRKCGADVKLLELRETPVTECY